MNPEQSSRDEIEMKLTALLLGELPADEAKLLRYTISQDASLQKMHDELAQTIVLVREVEKAPASAPVENAASLKLSEERRAKLLAQFKTPSKADPLSWLKRIDVSRIQAPRLLTVLAVLAIVAVLAAMMLPALSKAKYKSPRIAALNAAKQRALDEAIAKSENSEAVTASLALDKSLTALPVANNFEVNVATATPASPIVLPAAEAPQQIDPATGLPSSDRKADLFSQSTVGYVNQALAAMPVPEQKTKEVALGISGTANSSTVDNLASLSRRQIAGVDNAAPLPGSSRFGFAGGGGGGGADGPPVSSDAGLAWFDPNANRSAGEKSPANLGEEFRRNAPTGTSAATVAFDIATAEPQKKLPTLVGGSVAGTDILVAKSKLENSDQRLTGGVRGFYDDNYKAGDKFYRQKTDGEIASVNGSIAPAAVAAPAKPVDRTESLYFAGGNLAKQSKELDGVNKSGGGTFALGDIPKDAFQAGLAKEDFGGLHLITATNAIVLNGEFSKIMGPLPGSAVGGSMPADADRPLPKPAPNAPIPQPEILTRENNFSTFSLNVSDVSFKLAAASLEKGQLPDAASIRSEEFINAFDYRDPEAAAGQPLAFVSERAAYPFAQNRDLLRFSVKTAAAGRAAGRPLNLVLLLDNSGSMERADRVAIIREALRVLGTQLQPQDKVSVVTFARTARLWADGVSGDKAGETLKNIGSLTPEGGTNLEEAMRLAYETAHRHYAATGMNRVVLLTDGAANLGDVNPADLKQKVEAQRKQGIALDCFGIGQEDYNDDLLEQLSRNGDGRYAFLNSPEEVNKEFAAKLAGALQIAASDVKVQVEFNPQRVISYRQIGYAKHQLTKEQFRDNTVDAAEIAAQEAGNALYTVETKADGVGPIATVRVRYKVPGTTDYRERSWDVPYAGSAVSLAQSSAAMRLAATASAFSEWLAASPFAQEVTPDELLKTMSGVPQIYGADQRPQKLEWMIRQAKSVAGK